MPRTILIADDESMNREILRNMLSRDYSILTAGNGTQALEVLRERHAVISAVILDLKMPDMDGFDVLTAMRADERYKSIPVIVATSLNDIEAEERAVTLGAYGFVTKPYRSVLIRRHLSNAISFRETAALQNIIRRDELTGIPNMRGFTEQAELMIKSKPLGYYMLSCFDIDSFKVINDQYGTNKGDQVLKHVADTINECVSPLGGICCRLSSDDFATLYPISYLGSEILEEGIRRMTNPPCIGRSINIRIGRYTVDEGSVSVSTMYDRAMLAKDSIRGKYDVFEAVYDSTMRKRLLHEQRMVNEMSTALAEEQFEVWYQPQFNHSSGAMIGAEALVRWRHPEKGLIAPSEFIPVFERNGFIYALDRYIWEEVCKNLRSWIDMGRNPLPISVNISREDISKADLVQVLTELLDSYRLDISLLRLEITETAFAGSSDAVSTLVKRLIARGFTVEIDDFGSGYSSLNTLKDIPAQILKLDMKFLESGDDNQRGGNILESIVRMAKWLGMSVIAEGVETLEQANYLSSIGCLYMQGYLYARPMPKAKYMAFCGGNSKEEHLLVLQTVDNLDNSAFWDPKSMDTLIFNSYVGGACIFEYHNGGIELLRVTKKYAQLIGGGSMTVEDVLKLDWSRHLDEQTSIALRGDLERSITEKTEIIGEYIFRDLPNCPHETYLRSTLRVIASAGDRHLVYCTNENVTAQRQAERELREANEQMRRLMNDTPGGFVRVNIAADGSRSTEYINEGFVSLLGWPREKLMSLISEDIFSIVHPDDLEVVKAAHRALDEMLKTGRTRRAQYRLQRGDGSYIWLSVLGRATKSANGGAYLNTYYMDASEQVKEADMQKALLDNLPGGAGIYRLKDEQLTLISLNKSYWELVGRTPETSASEAVMSGVHPDDAEIILKELYAAVQQGRSMECDVRLLHSDKGFVLVRLHGRVIAQPDGGYLIYATFIPTESVGITYQQMLPLLLSTVMESSGDYVFAKDKDFVYISCSPAFLKLAGLERVSQVAGKTDFDLFPLKMAEQFRKNDILLMDSGEPLVDFDEVVYDVDGMAHYCLASKHVLRDATGEKIGIYGVSRDITREKSAFEQLQLVNDSLPGGIATYSYENGRLRVVYCNDGFLRLYAGTREGLEQRGEFDPMDFVLESDKEKLMNEIEALVRDDTPMDCLIRIRAMDNSIKWINQKIISTQRQGDRVLFNAMLLDVTQRQIYNERLRISEEENALAVKHGGIVVCRFDVAERSLTFSPSAAAVYGVPEKISDVPYEPVSSGLISKESANAFTGFFESIISGCQPETAVFQQRYLGSWLWLEAKGTTIFSDDGKPVKAVISFVDVTDMREKESIYKKWQHSLEDRAPDSYTLFRCNLSKGSHYETREGTLLASFAGDEGRDFNESARAYVAQYIHPDDREQYTAFVNTDALLADYYRGKRSATMEYRMLNPDGSVRWINLAVDLVEAAGSTDVEAYLMHEDIDETKKALLRTQELSEIDPLTGILNRKAFAAKVDGLLSSSEPGVRHAMLMLDIDGFKQVNDVFGHGAGDQTLTDIAAALRSALRREDLVARLGGDEFVMFLCNIPSSQDVAAKARKICALMRKAYSMEVQISGSIGIALSPEDGTNFNTLYKKADSALYCVKGSGKDSYTFYDSGMADKHMKPEEDVLLSRSDKAVEKRRRMLIVDDSAIDHALLQNIFSDDFIVEKARDGSTALVRLRHYGAGISVVLLDLMMPGMDGFGVLRKMQESAELRSIPVIIVSGDESRETCLEAIRQGAADFITKPVDADLLRTRVYSAVSRADSQRLRAENSMLGLLNDERLRYDAAMSGSGFTFVEFDASSGRFSYHPSVSRYLLGVYNERPLWQILTEDKVAHGDTISRLQQLVQSAAEDKARPVLSMRAPLKTPGEQEHSFRITVNRPASKLNLGDRLIISLDDLDYEVQDERRLTVKGNN